MIRTAFLLSNLGCGLMLISQLSADNPIVRTPLGVLKGSNTQTVLGKTIYAFRGIRYARAPINELRFQPPVPIDCWSGIYDATEDGYACPQPARDNTNEDCLFLNVYTTVLPSTYGSPSRPVMVFVHPGSFDTNSGMSDSYGPDYILDQDLVLVVLNYRLGSLGFMSTGDKLAPGNNGLKDQVMALKWVKQNIASFGGNPDLVTLAGCSAGGASVSLHLVSPMSKGLFHRAIIMSGSNLGNWPVPHDHFDLAQKQARFVGCPDTTSAAIISCLQTKSSDEIADTLDQFKEFGDSPVVTWLPVIEPDFGQERFLTDDPVKLILRGEFASVPVMAGITAKEFEFAAYVLFQNETLFKELDEYFEKFAPICFMYERYERETENSKRISRELRQFYLGKEAFSEKSLPGIGKLFADGVIGFGVNRAAKLSAAKNTKSTYYYRFSYEGRYSMYYPQNSMRPKGNYMREKTVV